MRNFSRWFLLLVLPAAAGITALVLFLLQGGFGGGHGRFDQAIGVLGVPGIFLSAAVVGLFGVPQSDLGIVVVLPALFNFALTLTIALVLRRLTRRSGAYAA
jgi:hypothetical protein